MFADYPEMNAILLRIRRLCEERGWTMYRLSKETEIPPSSISNMFRRNTMPSVDTIDRFCRGFGITMSDFFETPLTERADQYTLADDEQIVIEEYRGLSKSRKELLRLYLHGLAGKKPPKES